MAKAKTTTAQAETKKPQPEKSELLTMVKENESIQVHPCQVAPWESQGWKVKE